MDQLIHAAGTFRDKNLYWVNYSPDPADIGPKVRDFLATSRNARLFPGQDADHFFLDLSRFLGTGVPSALSQPLGQATRVMRDLTAAKMKDADILAEIASARSRLKRLTDADAVTAQEGDPVEAVVTRIREQRLAGNHAEAYRLAHEALSP